MRFLTAMKIQAEQISEELKNQVKEKFDELTIKVDNAKEDALVKEKRDKVKVDQVCQRLNQIKTNLKMTKDKWENRMKQAE